MTEISQKDIDALENKNKLLLSQIQYLNDELHKTRKSFEEEKRKHEEDIEAARSDLTHMVKESVELKTQIQTLQEDLDDVEDQMISMVSDKSLRNENLALRKDIRTLTKKLEEIAEQYEMVRDEYNSALFEANELRKQSLTQKNDLLVKTNELKRAWRELEQNRADMAMMMREYAEARQQDDTPTNWKEMESDNRRLKSELDTVTRHNETITTLLNELRMEIGRINELNSTLPDLSDVTDDSKSTKLNGETLETHGIITTIFSPEDVSNCITLLLNSLSVMISDFSQSNVQDLIRRISSLLLVKKQLIAINDEATVLTHREDQHREALMNQEVKIDELEQQIKNLQRMNDNLSSQMSAKSADAHLGLQQLKEKDKEIEELKQQIKALSLESSTSQTSLLSKEKQIQSIRMSTSSIIEELETAKTELTKETIDLQQQVTELTKETIELQQQVTELTEMKESNEKTISTQKKLIEMKESSIKELTKRVETLSSISSQLRSTNDQSTSQNTIVVTQLKRELADKEKRIKELEDELDDAEDALDDEKDITAKLRKDLKEVTETRDHLRSDLKEVENDNDELVKELKKANELNKRYQEKEKDYLNRLHEKDELQNQVITLQQQVVELKAYNKAKEQEIPHCERVDGPVVVYTSPEEVTEYAQEMAVMPDESNEVVELCFKNCSLENDDIAVVSTVFEMGGFANVRRLDVSGNNMSLRGCSILFQAVAERSGGFDDYQKWKQGKDTKSENKNFIQVLNIANNRIKSKGFMQLLKRIKEGKYPMLWELDVSNNDLDDSCVKEMITFLRTNPKASSLHLVSFDSNGISHSLLQEFNTVLAASYS